MSIEIQNESGADVDVHRLERLARHVLDEMKVHPYVEVSIRLVDIDAMTTYHENYLHEPGPTDVLAFPMDELHDQRHDRHEDDELPPTLLGDVLLCPEVAARQAQQVGHSTEAELHLLCAHGLLHLLGYDHGDPAEEREMFSLQTGLLDSWAKSAQRSP